MSLRKRDHSESTEANRIQIMAEFEISSLWYFR